jgi:predicted transcriptional regulator
MSIKPRYSHKIITQNKTIEIRKKIGKYFNQNEYVFIYSSHPDKKIIGFFQIDSIISFDNNHIDDDILVKSCLTKDELLGYINNKTGYGIKIKNVKNIQPITLHELKYNFKDFTPPQSFRYIDSSMLDFLKKRIND